MQRKILSRLASLVASGFSVWHAQALYLVSMEFLPFAPQLSIARARLFKTRLSYSWVNTDVDLNLITT